MTTTIEYHPRCNAYGFRITMGGKSLVSRAEYSTARAAALAAVGVAALVKSRINKSR